MKKRILIVVNKSWECEPFMEAFKKNIPESPVVDLSFRETDNYMSSCRAEYHLKNYDVIIRCIQDLMDLSKGKSNSEEKYRVLPGYISADKPDFVISVSTAESTPEGKDNLNGCVVFGGQYFIKSMTQAAKAILLFLIRRVPTSMTRNCLSFWTVI